MEASRCTLQLKRCAAPGSELTSTWISSRRDLAWATMPSCAGWMARRLRIYATRVARALALRGGRAIWLDCSGVECGKRGDLAQRRLAFSSDCIMQRPDPRPDPFRLRCGSFWPPRFAKGKQRSLDRRLLAIPQGCTQRDPFSYKAHLFHGGRRHSHWIFDEVTESFRQT